MYTRFIGININFLQYNYFFINCVNKNFKCEFYYGVTGLTVEESF